MNKSSVPHQKNWESYNRSNRLPRLTPEETIEWLQGMQALMYEIYLNNAGWRQDWDKENAKAVPKRSARQ